MNDQHLQPGVLQRFGHGAPEPGGAPPGHEGRGADEPARLHDRRQQRQADGADGVPVRHLLVEAEEGDVVGEGARGVAGVHHPLDHLVQDLTRVRVGTRQGVGVVFTDHGLIDIGCFSCHDPVNTGRVLLTGWQD